MTMVERHEQLNTLNDLYLDCTRGKGSFAVLTGAVASGKTELLHAFADRAVSDGAIFLSAAAARVERDLPLGTVRQLIRGANLPPPVADRAARLLKDAELAVMLHAAESEAAGKTMAPRMLELCAILLDLSIATPLLIGIDDIHYADASSLQFLSSLGRRAGSARVLVVLTQRLRQQPAQPRLYTEMLRQARCRQINVDLLSIDGVAELARQQISIPAANAIAAEVHAISGGNPLLARAIIEDCRRGANAGTADLTTGPVFDQAVVGCMYRSERNVLDVARALAVLGEQATATRLSRLALLDAEITGRALQTLSEAGLLEGTRLRHPRIGAAVLSDMCSDEASTLHTRAAGVLYAHGADDREVARHVVRGGHVEAPWHLHALQSAGEQAMLAGDLDLTLGCLRLASAHCDDPRQLAAIRCVLARAEWRLDPASASARHLTPLSADIRNGWLDGSQAVATVYGMLWNGRAEEAVDLLNHLNKQRTGDTDIENNIFSAAMWLRYLYPTQAAGLAPTRRPPKRSSRRPTRRPDPAHTVLIGMVKGNSGPASAMAAYQVLQRNRLGDTAAWTLAAAVTALIYADELDAAGLWCESLIEESTTIHAPTWRAVFTALLAEVALRQGELRKAEEAVGSALTIISPRSWGVAIGAPLGTALRATIATGDYELAASYLAVPTPVAMFDTPLGLHYLAARGWFYLATERHYAALADFYTCGELMTRWNLDVPGFLPWRADAALALLRIGDKDQASELLREQLERLEPGMPRTRGRSLRLLAEASDATERPRLLKEAVRALKQSGDRLELAYAFADLGNAMHAAGDPDRARIMRRTADRMAQECDAQVFLRTLRPGPPNRGSGRIVEATGLPMLDVLSEAERKVAILAALGHTNREIARKLFVTVSTVEQHLTRVYRKLQVRRRTDLPAELCLETG